MTPERPEGEWCGICSAYGNHDTAHHGTSAKGLAYAVGDSVVHSKAKCDQTDCLLAMGNLHGTRGRVEGQRGNGYTVSFPNHGRTLTVQLPASNLEPYDPRTQT